MKLKKKKRTQVDEIREHFWRHGKITSWDAIQKYRITRLASIIHILRTDEQMNITSLDRRNDDGKNWVEYKYIKETDGQFSLL